MVRNPMLGGESPIYFRLWHVDKDPAAAAKAIQNILASRKSQMQEEYRGCFTLQLAIDVDNNVKDQPCSRGFAVFDTKGGLVHGVLV